MPTIRYQNAEKKDGKVYGFFESSTNYWKAEALREKLMTVGGLTAENVVLSHADGENPSLSERLAAVKSESADYDYFISIHSNYDVDGSLSNYPAFYIANSEANGVDAAWEAQQRADAEAAWPYAFEAMGGGLEPYSAYSYTEKNIQTSRSPILQHSVPGYMVESFFHTYHPARHRALSEDYCRMEGIRLYRAIAAKLGLPAEETGYIMGVVKSGVETMQQKMELTPTSFSYRAGSHDEWVPLNGANVQLLDETGETVIQEYTVDENYNGIFVFEGVDPTKNYKVKALATGHQPLVQEAVVQANRTSYMTLLLTPGKEEVAPLPSLAMQHNWNYVFGNDYIPGTIKRVLQWGDNFVVLSHTNDKKPHISVVDLGKITRDGISTSNADVVRELSLKIGGKTEIVTGSGEYLAISDIAVTSDGQLVACSYSRCTSAGAGSVKLYKWQTLTSNPQAWVTATAANVNTTTSNTLSANFVNGDVGYTMAVDGGSGNCHITLSAVNEDKTELRYVHLNVVNNGIVKNNCSWTCSSLSKETQGVFLESATGFRLNASPLGSRRWVVDAENITAYEFTQASNSAMNTPNGAIPEKFYGRDALEVNYVQWAGHHLAVAPWYEESGGKPKGVKVLDISNGFNDAKLVSTKRESDGLEVLDIHSSHTEFDNSVYAVATAQHDGDALHIYHFSSNGSSKKLVKYSTRSSEANKTEAGKSSNKAIYAYNLHLTDTQGDHSVYKITFDVNDVPKDAYLVLYLDGTELDRIQLTDENVNADGTYEFDLDTRKLYEEWNKKEPGKLKYGAKLTWAIEVENYPVLKWAEIHANTSFHKHYKNGAEDDRVYHAVDKSPQSDMFGYTYVVVHNGTYTGLEGTYGVENGIYVLDPNYTPKNTGASKTELGTPYYRSTLNYVGKIALDKTGTAYVTTYQWDNNSGVWRTKFSVDDKKNVSGGGISRFLDTSTNDQGFIFNSAGNFMAYRPMSVSIQNLKNGDTRMWLMHHHNSGTPPDGDKDDPYKLSATSFDIAKSGQAIPKTWDKVGATYLTGINEVQNNPWYHGHVQATDEGIWVSIPRSKDMNATGYPALRFLPHGKSYDATTTKEWYSMANNADLMDFSASGFVVSEDETMLVFSVCGGNSTGKFNTEGVEIYEIDATQGKLLLYDIAWVEDTDLGGRKPVLTLRSSYPHKHGLFNSLSLDYAGNLLASGHEGFFVFSLPSKGENKQLTKSDDLITIYTPVQTDAPLGNIAIYAYDLRVDTVKKDLSEYCFSFKVNENATEAALVFFEAGTDEELGRLPLSSVPIIQGKHVASSTSHEAREAKIEDMLGNNPSAAKNSSSFSFAGYNSYFITDKEIAAAVGEEVTDVMTRLSWGVWVKSKEVTAESVEQRESNGYTYYTMTVPRVRKIYEEEDASYKTLAQEETARTIKDFKFVTHAVDKSPESDYFGRTYAMEYIGKCNSSNGLYVYNPLWQLQNTTPYTNPPSGKTWTWDRPMRFAVGPTGYVYMTDWGDSNGHAGIYISDPANLNKVNQFTLGTVESNGVVNNNGIYTASSSAMCAVGGTGENTVLYAHTEDAKGTLKANGFASYKIGKEQPNANSLTWGVAPSSTFTGPIWNSTDPFSIAASRHGLFVWGKDSNGKAKIWFHKPDGSNAYTYTGTELSDNEHLRTLIALSADETKLVVLVYYTYASHDPIGQRYYFLEYSVAWTEGIPTLTYKGYYLIDPWVNFSTDEKSSSNYPFISFLSLNFDYAGNLILSSGEPVTGTNNAYAGNFHVYSFPKANNSCLTPAKKAMQIKYVRTTERTNYPQRGSFSYDLRVTGKGDKADKEVSGYNVIMPDVETNTYTFTFRVNSEVKDAKATLNIYAVDAAEDAPLATYPIDNVTFGQNTFTLSADELPGEHLNVFTWAIEVEGAQDVTEWGVLYDENNGSRTWGTNTIDMSTESDDFARIYAHYHGESANTTNTDDIGSWLYEPSLRGEGDSWQTEHTLAGAKFAGQVSSMTTSADGTVYIGDYGTGTPGIVRGKPSTDNSDVLELANFAQNGAVYGMDVYGETLWAYTAADATDGSVGATRKLVKYPLSGDDPSVLSIAETNNVTHFRGGNVVATDKGAFVSLHGEWGIETDGDWSYNDGLSTTLQFYANDDGSRTFNSYGAGEDPSPDQQREKDAFGDIINGSGGGGFAISPNGEKLILQNATQQFLVFDLEWDKNNTPKLELAAVYTHGKDEIHQMTFDYGGNLIATGKGGMTVFAIPTGEVNKHETRASVKRRKIVKYDPYYDRIFVGGTAGSEKLWSEPENWDPQFVPTDKHGVLILADCEVDVANAAAGFIDLQKGKQIPDKDGNNPADRDAHLTILANGGLWVSETIRKVGEWNYDGGICGEVRDDAKQLLGEGDLVIKDEQKETGSVDAKGNPTYTYSQGSLVHFDTKGLTQATIELWGIHGIGAERKDVAWQYVAVPFALSPAVDYFRGSWLYNWNEPEMNWEAVGAYATVEPFKGYLLTQEEAKLYEFTGNIMPSTTQTRTLSRVIGDGGLWEEGEYGQNRGANFLGNSWTAPLQIAQMTTDDFVNAEATIYIYKHQENRTGGGTLEDYYVTTPIGFAEEAEAKVINPLQGFFVLVNWKDDKASTGESVGSVTLNYAELVKRNESEVSDLNPYRISRRDVDDSSQDGAEWWIQHPDNGYQVPVYKMGMTVTGLSGLYCDLRLYESERFSLAFDNGFDGRKLTGSAEVPYLAAASTAGDMAVLATPAFDGTFLHFQTGGEESYTVTFTYDEEEEYVLEDAVAGTQTVIATGMSYTFVPSGDDKYRFRIVRAKRTPDVAVEEPDIWASGDKLYLTNPDCLRAEVSVYGVDGKLVERIVTRGSLTPLNVPQMGVYMIEVKGEWGVKIIKHIM